MSGQRVHGGITSAQQQALRFLADSPDGRATAESFHKYCAHPRTLPSLLRHGLVDLDAIPASHVTITEAGRDALARQGLGKGKPGTGKCIRWIREHMNHAGDDCLMWPYNRARGYGLFGYNGKMAYAHRVMCELVNGPAPSSKHQTAHTCGKGHEGCVNPRHLVWKTPSENQLDRRQHGTAMLNPHGSRGRLTEQQWNEIRSLRGHVTQDEVAQRYGISLRHVRRIQQSERKDAQRFLTPAQVLEIRASRGKVNISVLAKKFGVSTSTISQAWRGLTYGDVA